MDQSLEFQMIELKQLLLYRGLILLSLSPLSRYKDFRLIVDKLKQWAKQLDYVESLLTKQYLMNLLIACTRAWEGYDEKNLFEPIFEQDPHVDINTTFEILKMIVANLPIIRIAENQNWIIRAKARYRIHIIILTKICQTEITDDLLDEFFNLTRFMKWSKYRQQVQKGFLALKAGLDKQSFINSLMHEFTHNLLRFVKKNKDFDYLSPKINKELRIYNQYSGKFEQCEASQYFDGNAEIQAFFSYISPFTLLK